MKIRYEVTTEVNSCKDCIWRYVEEDDTDGYFLHKEDAEKQLALTIQKEKDKLREKNNRTKELNKQIGLKNIYSGLINNIDKLSFNWEVEEIEVKE